MTNPISRTLAVLGIGFFVCGGCESEEMPYENMPESMWADMDKCVEKVMGEGKDKEAAVAICYTSMMGKNEGKAMSDSMMSKLDAMPMPMMRQMMKELMDDPQARAMMKDHNMDDLTETETREMLRKMAGNNHLSGMMRQMMKDAPMPDMPAESQRHLNALKTISENADELRVGNYIVVFGGRDLTAFGYVGNKKPHPALKNKDGSAGEFFTKATQLESDYTFIGRLPFDWEHGTGELSEDNILGYVDWHTKKIDDKGVFVERVLNRRNQYVQWLEELIKAGMVGTSSEAVPELVEKKANGEITRWGLKRDTLTVMPMEPRMLNENVVTAMKSLGIAIAEETPETPPQVARSATASVDVSNPNAQKAKEEPKVSGGKHTTEKQKMNDEIKAAVDEATKSLSESVGKLAAQVDKVTKALEKEPPKTTGTNISVEPEQKLPYKSIVKSGSGFDLTGLGDQLRDIANAARGHGVSPRLAAAQDLARKNIKAALGVNEEVGSEGGFLVQHDNAGWLAERAFADSALADKCTQLTIGAGFNGTKLQDWDETSRADGSHYGGMVAYWLNEAGTFTASQPAFRQIDLQLGKLTALYYATDEELEDAVGLSSRISTAYPRVMRWKIDNAILRGVGGAQPQGIIGHGYTVSVAKETNQTATTIKVENINKMYSRMIGFLRGGAVWLINQDIEPQLFSMSLAVGTGGVPVYMPANGLSDSPFGTLYGRPVIPLEQCSSLGTVGDIVFANFVDYLLAKKGDVQQASSIHVQFLTGQQVFRFAQRVTGQPAYSTKLTPANGSNTLSAFVTLDTRS